MTEYPTLTALMEGREPGSVKVRQPGWDDGDWFRPGARRIDHKWIGMDQAGQPAISPDETADNGPWLIVSEDPPALDTLRLEIAATILSGLHAAPAGTLQPGLWNTRHAYALAEADALISKANKS